MAQLAGRTGSLADMLNCLREFRDSRERFGKMPGCRAGDGIRIILQIRIGCRIAMIWTRFPRISPFARFEPAATVWW